MSLYESHSSSASTHIIKVRKEYTFFFFFDQMKRIYFISLISKEKKKRIRYHDDPCRP